MVKVGRQTEHDAMTRHQLFERVPIARARDERGSKWTIRAQPTCCDGSGSWCTIRYIRWHCTSQMHQYYHLKSCTHERRHSRVLALYDISVAFWHAQLPEDEPIAMYPPRGEEEAGYMWQMKRAMYGRVSSISTRKEFSKKQDMQHSRYVKKSFTVLRRTRWLQSTATTSS